MLARSSVVDRWTSTLADFRRPAIDAGSDRWVVPAADMSLAVVDRAGRPLRAIAANRPWTPRISPDGRRVAYGAFGAGRRTSDVWVTDLGTGATQRVTDDEADSNDPQWSPDGAVVAYSVSAPGGKDLAARRLDGASTRALARPTASHTYAAPGRYRVRVVVTDTAGLSSRDRRRVHAIAP
jgi:dipeptidyl aminopeptidase/acylaminoacyl peptidase